MANIRISQLPTPQGAILSSDLLPVVQNGQTVQTTVNAFLSATGVTPYPGSFTTLAYSETLTGGTGVVNLGSGQFYKDTAGNIGLGTTDPKINVPDDFQTFAFDSGTQTGSVIEFQANGTEYASLYAVNTGANSLFAITSAGQIGFSAGGNPVVVFEKTGAWNINGTGTAGQFLISNGPNTRPTWQTLGGSPTFVNLTYTGTLTGGTGIVNIGNGQFYKDALGNIGIGTISPASNQINFNAVTIDAGTGANVGSVIQFKKNGNELGSIYSISAGGGSIVIGAQNQFGVAVNNITSFVINNSGAWAIGNGYGTVNQVLSSNGPGAVPTWVSAAVGSVTSVSGTGTVNGITLTGTVTSNGSLTLGGALTGVSLTTQVTGTLPVANGGTGAATLTGYVKGAGTAAMTASATIPNTDITGLGTAATLNAGAANGVATLDGGGTVPVSQLPPAVIGALSYQGTWDASTNTPTLTSSVGTKGFYYVVNVAGNTDLNGITDWLIGDWAVYNGTVWQKIDNTDSVTSVNGLTGTVVLGYGNITTGVVPVANGGTGNTTGNAATATTANTANTAANATSAFFTATGGIGGGSF